jgi:large subunit ribosomal protein L19
MIKKKLKEKLTTFLSFHKKNKDLLVKFLKSGIRVNIQTQFKDNKKVVTKVFSGIIIKVKKVEKDISFTIRRFQNGFGVEKTFLTSNPNLKKIEFTQQKNKKIKNKKMLFLRNQYKNF